MGKSVLKSKFGIILGLGLLIMAGFSLARQLHRKYLIDQEIKQLKQEIGTLEGKNREVLELMSYLKSTEYKERQARSLLGLQKPGEFAVALPAAEVLGASEPAGKPAENRASNLKKWWDYFFSKQ